VHARIWIQLTYLVYRNHRNWFVLGYWKESCYGRSGVHADIVRHRGRDRVHDNAGSWRNGGLRSSGWIVLYFRWVSTVDLRDRAELC
jgi:hypothetical protein